MLYFRGELTCCGTLMGIPRGKRGGIDRKSELPPSLPGISKYPHPVAYQPERFIANWKGGSGHIINLRTLI
jgi:hypothetical protein